MKSETIKELRGQIDTLDDQIIELLLKRIQLSNSVMKMKSSGQIVDPLREEEIYRRYTDKLVWDPLESTCRHASLSIL